MSSPRICHVCGASNPPHARYCNQCGTFLDLALSPDVVSTEERRWVTILFADLVNSTALMERMDPEDARELISGCFDRLAHEIVAAGGTVDKFMGDAVMAIFGAPVAHEDDPARALRAALQMHASMRQFNSEQGLDLDLRIGVNTGQVVVGARHVGGLEEYTATGDAVNVAARLQQTAQPGQTVAGEETARLAGGSFRLQAQQAALIRGKQESVATYLVEGPREDDIPTASSLPPIINRRTELGRMRQIMDGLARGRGRIVILTGEPGIGKSRIIAEARALAGEGIGWTEGRAQSHGTTLNYHLFRGVTQQLFAFGSSDQDPARALRSMVERFGAPQAFPYLARVSDLPMDQEEYQELEHVPQDQVEQRAIRDISALVEGMSRRRPGVLALDDLHWADPASLALIGGFLPLVTRVPLLLLLSFRDEPGAAVGALRDRALAELARWTTMIELRPLTTRHTALLADQLLSDQPLLHGLRGAVIEKAEGNPLFAEEIVRSLVAAGVDGATAQSLDGRLPASIQGIILSRVDRLPESTRHALQAAAVVGREFKLDTLRAIEPAASVESLEPAVRAAIIDPVVGSDQYTFRHALTRDSIYRTLLRRRRRELHGRVTEALIASLSKPEDEAALLAYHAGEAHRWADVVKYAKLAGDQAGRAFASRDAIAHYTQALEALDRLSGRTPAGRRAELLRQRGRAHERTGNWQQAVADYEGALAAAPNDETRELAFLSLAMLWTDHDDYATALRWANQAHELSRANGDKRGYARALSIEARILVRQSRAQQAVERLTEALAVHREIGDRRGEAEALDNLAAPLSLLGDVVGAYERQHAALLIFRELGNREREGDVQSVLAEWLWFRGDFREALATARQARAIHEELGLQRYQAHDRLVEGMALSTLGQFREALTVLDAAITQAEQMEHPEWVAHALVPMGVVYRALHRTGRARRAFTRAAELGERIGARNWAQLGTVGLGFTELMEGNLEGAEACFRSVLGAPEGLQYPRARAMTGLGRVELQRGNAQLADDWARWSIAICEAAPYLEALLEAQILHGQTLIALEQRQSGLDLLEETQKRAMRIGARPLQAQARAALRTATRT